MSNNKVIMGRLERELMVSQVLELVCEHIASFFGENVAEGDYEYPQFVARDADQEVRFSELADVCRELHAAVLDSHCEQWEKNYDSL